MQGMNRIRHAYLELAPELEPYFVTSRYDDDFGILASSIARSRPPGPFQAFVAIPGVVAVLDSVVAGAVAGIAVLALDAGTVASITAGAFVSRWQWPLSSASGSTRSGPTGAASRSASRRRPTRRRSGARGPQRVGPAGFRQ